MTVVRVTVPLVDSMVLSVTSIGSSSSALILKPAETLSSRLSTKLTRLLGVVPSAAP